MYVNLNYNLHVYVDLLIPNYQNQYLITHLLISLNFYNHPKKIIMRHSIGEEAIVQEVRTYGVQ